MKGSVLVAKGRVVEAAGALVGNDRLRAKGRADQALGRVRQVGEGGVKRAKVSARQIVKGAKTSAKAAVAKAKGRR